MAIRPRGHECPTHLGLIWWHWLTFFSVKNVQQMSNKCLIIVRHCSKGELSNWTNLWICEISLNVTKNFIAKSHQQLFGGVCFQSIDVEETPHLKMEGPRCGVWGQQGHSKACWVATKQGASKQFLVLVREFNTFGSGSLNFGVLLKCWGDANSS